ncbi:Arrestin domain-containing protein 4 [Apophysomyces ossiformis]|uniref:Arrestin domain-containing protein 4 n=1 Tax=Apophysomyces ossiformis TaxID=679940 RepID=A0A8H7BK92_9FUNG|nr:Arrestin domain-containing protein 4 [Apophysomyces ossiformis]
MNCIKANNKEKQQVSFVTQESVETVFRLFGGQMPQTPGPRRQNDFYIELNEDRFYYSGEVIKGNVILDLAKPTKTNHVRIAFTGEVQSESSSLQLFNKILYLANPPDDEKSHVLEAQTHCFPFEFKIPGEDGEIPSSTQLPNLGGVKYLLTALHDKPFVPDSLSPQTKKEISILERIDVTSPEYCMKGNFNEQIQLVGSDDPRQIRVSMTLPKFGIVRGDILPVTIQIKHFHDLIREKAIKVQIIRRSFFGKSKGQLSEKKIIKSNVVDIDITGPIDFTQTSVVKMLFPTSTPPTIGESGKIVSIEYWIRAEINLNEISPDNPEAEHPKNIVYMEANVVVGTFPKPDLAIDDEDDEEEMVEGHLAASLNQISLDDRTAEKEPLEPAEETAEQTPDNPASEVSKDGVAGKAAASIHSADESHVDAKPSHNQSPHSRKSSVSRHSIQSNIHSDPPTVATPVPVPSPTPSQEQKPYVAMPDVGKYLPQNPPAIPPKPVQSESSPAVTSRLNPYYQQPYDDYGSQGDKGSYTPSFPIAMPMPQHQASFSTPSLSTSPYLRPSPSPTFPIAGSPSPTFPIAGSPSAPVSFPLGYYPSPIMSERPPHGYGEPDGTPAPNNYWMPPSPNYPPPPPPPPATQTYPHWS